jgi:CRP-like cAMP-binding protein
MINISRTAKHGTAEDAQPMLQLFGMLYPMSKGMQEYMIQHTYPVTFRKGESLHRAGTVCNYIYFIKSGAVRGYIRDGKKDSTTWITVEGEMVTAIYSFLKQETSIENVQALEDCELLAISYTDLQRAYERFPGFNIIARFIYEKYYADAEIRALTARLSKVEKKYEYFLQAYSHLSNRIPLKYIASFLGTSLETLSRIRGQKRNRIRKAV